MPVLPPVRRALPDWNDRENIPDIRVISSKIFIYQKVELNRLAVAF
jgi:hypothetical protein